MRYIFTYMKTSIDITDAIFEEAKRVAHQEGTTVRALVEDGLRRVLRDRREARSFRLRRVTFCGNGLRPEVEGAAWTVIRDLTYEGRGA